MRGLYTRWSELPYEEAVSALQEDALFVAASCWGERFYQALRSRVAGDQGRHKRVLFSFEIYQDQHAASVRTRFDALEGIEDLAMLYYYMSGQLQRGAALAQRMDDFVTQGRPLGFLYALWTWLMLGHVERAHETLGRWRQQHTFYQESPSTQALLLALEASIHSAAHSYHQEERILAQACALIQGTIHGQLYWSLEITRRGAHMLWRGVAQARAPTV